MGLVKLCITIIILIFTILLIDVFLGWIYGEEENNHLRVYNYALKDMGFCKTGNISYDNNSIDCKQKYADRLP